MGLASAILGPLCDGQHSAHGVLHYADPVHLTLLGALTLETCWWVPLLFGAAGVILGVAHPLLDAWLPESRPRWGTDPSWAVVVLGIAVFVLQYAASGILEPQLGHSLGPLPALDALLAGVAWAHWAAFDGTRQGLFMACLTAVAGPAVEVGLINGLHLYHYTHAQAAGIPLWIPWVYFCGAPAVLEALAEPAALRESHDGTKAGVGAEAGAAAGAAARGGKQLTLQEAQMILGIESGATWEEIVKKYDHLFEANQKSGSFYLQSKVYRAKERLEQEFKEQGLPTDAPGQQQQQQQGGEQ
eukprot:scaffold14.g1118.t1